MMATKPKPKDKSNVESAEADAIENPDGAVQDENLDDIDLDAEMNALMQEVNEEGDVNPENGQEIAEDDPDIQVDDADLEALMNELDEPKAKPKPQSKETKHKATDVVYAEGSKRKEPKTANNSTYQKTAQEVEASKNLSYEELFNYFANLFYHFCFSLDNPDISNIYLESLQNLAPLVFHGHNEYDPEAQKINMLNLGKKLLPYAQYSHVTNKQIQTPTILMDVHEMKHTLETQLSFLKKLKDEYTQNPAAVKEIQRALALTERSLLLPFDPRLLLSDYIHLTEANTNPNLQENEIQVTFKSIVNGPAKGKYRISLMITQLGNFSTKELDTPTNESINYVMTNSKYNPKYAQNLFKGNATLKVGHSSIKIPLAPLLSKCTYQIQAEIDNAKVAIEVSIREPVNPQPQQTKIISFQFLPPLIDELTNTIGNSRPAPSQQQAIVIDNNGCSTTNAVPTPTAVKPTNRTAAAPKKSATPSQTGPVPKPTVKPPKTPTYYMPLIILSEEEREQFWGEKALEIFSDKIIVQKYRRDGLPVPDGYLEQCEYFKQKLEHLRENADGLDPLSYLEKLKQLRDRQNPQNHQWPENEIRFRQLVYSAILDEIKFIEANV